MLSSSTTTSWPNSTRRFARSIASSATIVWSPGGRSNVDAMTSPFTDRCMSVTSSGRSSTSTTMRWHSGLFVVIALAMFCMIGVLPVDRVDAHERVELLPRLLALAWLAHGAGDRVAATQPVLADHRQRDVDVRRARQVAGGADEGVVVEDVDDAGDREQHVAVAHLGVDVALAAAAAVAVAVAAPAAVAEPAAAPA